MGRQFESLRCWFRAGRILKTVDADALRRITNRYQDYEPGIPLADGFRKYLDIREWLVIHVRFAYRLGLHRSDPQTVLDIGTGPGYFPFICRYFGHDPLAIDLHDPLCAELIALLNVKRVIAKVSAFENLPGLGRRFDLVTALGTQFDRGWGIDEWTYFLRDVARNQLTERGRLFMSLNTTRKNARAVENFKRALSPFFAGRGAEVRGKAIYFRDLAAFRSE